MSDSSDYVLPRVWTWDQPNGGQFENINRPIAGPTHRKDLPVGKNPFQLYSLATRADADQVSAIEKLTGHKIPRTSASREVEPKAKAEKVEPRAGKSEPKRSPKADKPREERSPVVEDIKSDWNGPLPGFLSVSAD